MTSSSPHDHDELHSHYHPHVVEKENSSPATDNKNFSSPFSLASDGVDNEKEHFFHAHFDCFSGAAGDMMLASCLDASSDPSALLNRIKQSIEEGIPELRGEFDITMERVWRGMGSIAACKVTVHSKYGHEAAPVPSPAGEREKEETITIPLRHHCQVHDHSAINNKDCHDQQMKGKEDATFGRREREYYAHSHEHSHGHEHSHNHGHQNLHEHSDPHSYSHDNDHTHSHSHHGHSHDHYHSSSSSSSTPTKSRGPLRNLPQIKSLLESASSQHIPPRVASLAISAFTELAIAESHIHGSSSPSNVHFHEVGAIDSIVDTVGTILALHYLNVRTVSCSRLPLGEGTVWTDHGLLPVPAPATLRLLMGMPTCPGPSV